ncbi:hypothetical protein C2G38_2191888 [Gigaspora rosea]|uniref:RNase H type-1 domain-containing protein n=1 Tax=Gigaspora rosea TaxID=44941 RepID=A0A397V8P8_9GLOM|nr:hypothetical protein C2G38_2191888 [Gigaspora rosea]
MTTNNLLSDFIPSITNWCWLPYQDRLSFLKILTSSQRAYKEKWGKVLLYQLHMPLLSPYGRHPRKAFPTTAAAVEPIINSSKELKKEYRLEGKSNELTSPIKKKVCVDKRCKDWVVVKRKNSSSLLLERISKKLRCKAILEHWVKTQKVKSAVKISRCKGCSLNKGGKENDCQFTVEMKEYVSRVEEEVDSVVEVNRIEFEVIKKQGLSRKITRLLLEMAEKNIKEKRSNYVFYTDSSWYKEEEGIEDRIGSAWVQLDRKEEIVSLVGKIRVVDWPSLTKSELVAILCALLVVKSDSLVVVKTDSLAAISSIESEFRSRSFKKSLKLKNRSILDKIIEITQVKNLTIELCKVKAHDGIVWNELTDKLAKEAVQLEEDWNWLPANSTRWNASIWWNGKHIDNCP